jgi:hypothetical protein
MEQVTLAQCRQKAQEMKSFAESTTDADVRAVFRDLARHYEVLACQVARKAAAD